MVDKSDPKNPRVTDEVRYFTADEEDDYHVAQANAALDENGYFVKNTVSGRYRDETSEFDKSLIYFSSSSEIIRNMLVRRLDHTAAIMQRYLLCCYQCADNCCNVDFTPSVRDRREAALDISHGSR